MASGQKLAASSPELTMPLAQLDLDEQNPRFGNVVHGQSQANILDLIVDRFGIDDVLSSLAVNGFFKAEPLVCRLLQSGRAVVVEGNRRLAACCIIVGDARASGQKERTRRYRQLWEEHGQPPVDPVPVILFDENVDSRMMLSYLGVRHISGSQAWDSYAKAVWVARAVKESGLSIRDISLMIGDEYRTIARLLEGYSFMQQLIKAGEFDPASSVRKGRGTLTEYPFSWVYTILGYTAARAFLGLDEGDATEPGADPLKMHAVPKGGLLVRSMFGDRSRGRNSVIEDSRELGALAAAFANPEKVALLDEGRSLDEATRATAPIETRLRAGLANVRRVQQDIITGLTERGAPSVEIAEPLLDMARINRRTARDIEKRLEAAASLDDTPDD